MKLFGFEITREKRSFQRFTLGGFSTGTLGPISETEALRNPSVWSALRRISKDLGAMPLKVYERSENGRVQLPFQAKSFLPHLTGIAPNNYQTPPQFFGALVFQYLLYGNAYVYKSKNQAGEVVQLHLVHPSYIQVSFDETSYTKYYKVFGKQNEFLLTDGEIIHVYDLKTNAYKGQSLLEVGSDTLGNARQLQRFSINYLKNNSTPSGILKSKNKMDSIQKDRAKADWKSRMSGDGQGDIAVFDVDADFQAISSNTAKDSQLIEQKQYSSIEIANLFNLPPHMLGDLTKSSYSSLDAQGEDYWRSCLRPIAVDIETSFNRGLVSSDYQGLRYFEFDYSSITKPDATAQYNLIDKMLKGGTLTLNQALEMMNRPTFEGGNVRFVPQNFALMNEDGSISQINNISQQEGNTEDKPNE